MMNINTTNTDFMNMIKEIKAGYPLLSKEEELTLLVAYKETKDKNALDTLLLSNVGFILQIASQFPVDGKVYDIEDLFTEGVCGLKTAIEKYDIMSDNRLLTYAGYWIKQAIRRYIETHDRIISIPVHITFELSQLKQEQANRISQGLDGKMDINDIVKFLGCTKDRAYYLLKVYEATPMSLNAVVGDEDDTELIDLVASENSVQPEEECEKNETISLVHNALRKLLNPREQEIIIRRMGLNGRKSETLAKIAEDLGITRERVRQLEEKALAKLRKDDALKRLWVVA